jgi:hypothetical protein
VALASLHNLKSFAARLFFDIPQIFTTALFAGASIGVKMSKITAMTIAPAAFNVLLGGKAAHSTGVKIQANSPEGPVISLHWLLAQLITSARYF